MSTLLTIRQFGLYTVRQREAGGYVSGTDLCKIFGKKFKQFRHRQDVRACLAAVQADPAFAGLAIIQVKCDDAAQEQGVWLHPMMAYKFAFCLPSAVLQTEIFDWTINYVDLTSVRRDANMNRHIIENSRLSRIKADADYVLFVADIRQLVKKYENIDWELSLSLENYLLKILRKQPNDHDNPIW